jgi:hypothetical protein
MMYYHGITKIRIERIHHMDTITTAIITALSAGTIAGLTDTAKTAVNDGYNKLKGLLTKKHGESSEVVQAIKMLEAMPASTNRQGMVAEVIATAKAEQDDEIIAAAKQILILVKSQQTSTGKFNIQNNGPVQGQVMENNAPITMNFGELPKGE